MCFGARTRLKGAARAVDLPLVEEVAHQLEALFTQVIEGTKKLETDTIAAVRLSLDTIEDLVAEIDAPSGSVSSEPALHALGDLLGQPLREAPPAPPEKSEPSASKPEQPAAPEQASGSYLRVAADQMEQLSSSMHQLLAEIQADEAISDDLQQIEFDVRDLRRGWDVLQTQVKSAGLSVDGARADGRRAAAFTSRLRAFDQDLKSLFRTLSSLARDRKKSAWTIEQAARQVRDDIDRVSLVSADTVFGSFGHMVRDIARNEGRDVHVRIVGLDIQVDRRVLQSLKDPDHASLAQRGEPRSRAVGRADREGKARARRDHPRTRIPWRSPRGQHPRRRARARSRAGSRRWPSSAGSCPGASPGERMPMMDQLLSLVFTPGFSTATEVDRLSGRGMGLSVVAEAARKLHGSVLLRPRFPWGTEALLNVPFTAARQPLLLAEAEGRTFGFPTYGIERLLRLRSDSLESVEGRPAARIEIGGQDVVVPVVALAALTGSPNAQIPTENGSVKAVLVRHGPGTARLRSTPSMMSERCWSATWR